MAPQTTNGQRNDGQGVAPDDLGDAAILAAIRAILYGPETAGQRIDRIWRLLRGHFSVVDARGDRSPNVVRSAIRRAIGRE